MTLKQAKRFYEFVVGQITKDIDGELCIRTMDGKLYQVPSDERDYVEKCLGYICTFWMNKKSKNIIKNVGVCGVEPEKLTESTVNFLWDINFASAFE